MGLAREYHTPIPYLLELPLRELQTMKLLHNELCNAARERAEAAR